MNEIEAYLMKKELDLSISSDTNPIFIKQYEYGQLLLSIGRHKDALRYLKEAYDAISLKKIDPIWLDQYCRIGSQYAMILDYLNDQSTTEVIYEQIMSVNPTGLHIGDYALFLHRRKREYDKAEAFYLKALELYPEQSSIILKYAGFLRHIKRDVSKSESYYVKAIEVNPTNGDALGSYASFLHGVYNKTKEAEEYYVKAIQCDPIHANNLCNYGLFLSEEKLDFGQAEIMYKMALEVSSIHSNTLYNYAVMLDTHLKRKEEAEGLYRRAIDIESRHAYALYNLAVLLEEKQFILSQEPIYLIKGDPTSGILEPSSSSIEETKKARIEISSFYKRAVDADPRDSATLADYGRYLLIRLEEPNKAEPILLASLKLDPCCEIAIFNMAILLHRYKHNFDSSTSMLRSLLQRNPRHHAGTLQLARILIEKYQVDIKTSEYTSNNNPDTTKIINDYLEEAMELYENAVNIGKEIDSTLIEYMKLTVKYGNNRQKLHTISFINEIIRTKMKGSSSKENDATTPALQNAKLLLETLQSGMK